MEREGCCMHRAACRSGFKRVWKPQSAGPASVGSAHVRAGMSGGKDARVFAWQREKAKPQHMTTQATAKSRHLRR